MKATWNMSRIGMARRSSDQLKRSAGVVVWTFALLALWLGWVGPALERYLVGQMLKELGWYLEQALRTAR